MKYAVYDSVSIYGVGDTPGNAIANAFNWPNVYPGIETAPISEELASEISRNGWNTMNKSFDIDPISGYIIDTTEE